MQIQILEQLLAVCQKTVVLMTALISLYMPQTFGGIGDTPSFVADNKTVNFAWTDDNTKENFIIRSDKAIYESPTVYFSVENTTATDKNAYVVFTLKNDKTKVSDVKEFISNEEVFIYPPSATNTPPKKTVSNWQDKSLTLPNMTTLSNLLIGNSSIAKKPTIGNYYVGFQTSILAGQTKYYKADIHLPSFFPKVGSKELPERSQSFNIEAFSLNTYGHLE